MTFERTVAQKPGQCERPSCGRGGAGGTGGRKLAEAARFNSRLVLLVERCPIDAPTSGASRLIQHDFAVHEQSVNNDGVGRRSAAVIRVVPLLADLPGKLATEAFR